MTTVPVIIKRMHDLGIIAFVREGKLILRAEPGIITEKAKRVISENKAEIVAYIVEQEQQSKNAKSFEEQIAAIFPDGCTITTQPEGYTIEQRIADAHGEKPGTAQKQKRPNWTQDQWQAACQLQYRRVRDYEKRLGNPIPIGESYVGWDGYMVVPSFKKREEL